MADDRDASKRAAGYAAAERVEEGMLLGLGTGSTVAFLLDALGERIAGGLRIRAVATSLATERRARELGIPVEDFAPLAAVDLVIDGVDEIDPAFRAIKGGGGALLREKIVATSAARMIAIADSAKPVARLGGFPLPIEVLGFARGFVTARIAALGGVATPRAGTLSDQGNPLLDCRFTEPFAPETLAAELDALPGVLAHGLFLTQIDELCVGGPDGAEWREKEPAA